MPESTRALKNEKHWAVNHSSQLSITASLSDPRLLFTQAPWMRKSLVTVSVNRQWILKVRVWSGRIGIRTHFQDKHPDLKVRCEREALKRLAGVCAVFNTGEPANSPLTPSRWLLIHNRNSFRTDLHPSDPVSEMKETEIICPHAFIINVSKT